MMEWTWEYRYLCEILISVHLDVYLVVELLDSITQFNLWRRLYIVFHNSFNDLHPYQQCSRVAFSLHLSNICYLLVIDSPKGVSCFILGLLLLLAYRKVGHCDIFIYYKSLYFVCIHLSPFSVLPFCLLWCILSIINTCYFFPSSRTYLFLS